MSRTVLVMGASGDIGGAVAAAFARGGDKVALGYYTNEIKTLALCDELRREGARVMGIAADVANSAEVAQLYEQVEREFGPVQVLVNGAGFAQQKLAGDISDTEWNRMMAVHAGGTFYCCRRALPHMIREKAGVIINIASMWGQVGASCEVHYSAAKAAVIGLTKALAKEVGPSGIRVNCVAPGAINTGMMAAFTAEEKKALCEETPLGRLGTVRDVADAVVFLASEGAAFFTGQVLAPNGGFVV